VAPVNRRRPVQRWGHRFLSELVILASLRGWYFESAEGGQSRYGFAGDPVASKTLAERVASVQHEHKELVAGQT
jgi:hypothetical protein